MRKLTNVLDENTKSDYQTEVRIELENGLVLEGTFKVTDYGLSYAKDTSSKLVESKIKSVEVLNVEAIVEKVETKTDTETEDNAETEDETK